MKRMIKSFLRWSSEQHCMIKVLVIVALSFSVGIGALFSNSIALRWNAFLDETFHEGKGF